MATTLAVVTMTTALWTGCATRETYNETKYNEGTEASRTDVPRYKHTDAPAAPAAKPAIKAEAPSSSFTLKNDLLQLTKRVPAKATLGSTILAEIIVTALADCANVTITDTIPAGATLVKSEPAATVNGQKLTWNMDTLDKSAQQSIKVWYKADKEGTLVNCATMAAIPRGCAATFVGHAQIAIEKSGPETAKLGSQLTYNIVVKNTGNADAEDVIVTDTVPDGLSSATGQKTLTYNIGTLLAGQSKEIPVALKAAATGKHCNAASVATSNAGTAKDDACTTIVKPALAITKTGTKEQLLGRNAAYEIVVSNTGDTALTGVSVVDTAPAETKIVSATGASVVGNTATWNLSELKVGEKKSFAVTLTSLTAGTHCNGATVKATSDNLAGDAQACTVWKGVAAILLQTQDDPDPIQLGESTTYTIRVTNQGTADDTNVKVVVKFAKEIDPINAQGGVVNGKTVTFPAIPKLAPKQVVTYTITGKGMATGDHRLNVDLTSDVLTEPVTHEESTHVY
ncbi:MAG: OmcB family cysteine-rich outer membrane protein [Verrucomicrobiota bacterium]